MRIVLAVLFASFKTGASLKCAHCIGRDEVSCREKLTIKNCPYQYRNPVCVTLRYSEKLNKEGKIVPTTVKKCSEGSGCTKEHCSRFWVNCKTVCCGRDLCNSGNVKEPEVNQKAKRRITGDVSSAMTSIASVTLHIVVTMFFLLSFVGN